MLTSFGTFWGAEGAGVHWPGNDAFLLVLISVYALVCVGYTVLLRRTRAATPVPDPAPRPATLTSGHLDDNLTTDTFSTGEMPR